MYVYIEMGPDAGWKWREGCQRGGHTKWGRTTTPTVISVTKLDSSRKASVNTNKKKTTTSLLPTLLGAFLLTPSYELTLDKAANICDKLNFKGSFSLTKTATGILFKFSEPEDYQQVFRKGFHKVNFRR